MDYGSATNPEFFNVLESWFGNLAEMLVLIRYSASAGSREFEFFASLDALSARMRELPPRTSIIAFRQPQLTLRGVVDDGFIETCLNQITDGSEFLLVETGRTVAGKASWFHHQDGKTHADLRDALEASRGSPVAVGSYPAWLEDSKELASAIVPDEDGSVTIGIY